MPSISAFRDVRIRQAAGRDGQERLPRSGRRPPGCVGNSSSRVGARRGGSSDASGAGRDSLMPGCGSPASDAKLLEQAFQIGVEVQGFCGHGFTSPKPRSVRSRRIARRWRSNAYRAAGTRRLRSPARRPSAGPAAAFRPGKGRRCAGSRSLVWRSRWYRRHARRFPRLSVGKLCLSPSAARCFSPRQ